MVMRSIKEHLPKLQFVAVVITITLGGHTVYDRFLREDRPVLAWHVPGFSIRPGAIPHTYNVVVARRKLRSDCPLRSFDAGIVDSEGFTHAVSAGVSRTAGHASDRNIETFAWVMRIPEPGNVAAGRARLVATLVYECREGQQVVEYPQIPGLEFEVTDARH